MFNYMSIYIERSNNPYEYVNYRSITMSLINELDTGIPAVLRFDHNVARVVEVHAWV